MITSIVQSLTLVRSSSLQNLIEGGVARTVEVRRAETPRRRKGLMCMAVVLSVAEHYR